MISGDPNRSWRGSPYRGHENRSQGVTGAPSPSPLPQAGEGDFAAPPAHFHLNPA